MCKSCQNGSGKVVGKIRLLAGTQPGAREPALSVSLCIIRRYIAYYTAVYCTGGSPDVSGGELTAGGSRVAVLPSRRVGMRMAGGHDYGCTAVRARLYPRAGRAGRGVDEPQPTHRTRQRQRHRDGRRAEQYKQSAISTYQVLYTFRRFPHRSYRYYLYTQCPPFCVHTIIRVSA